MRIFVVNGMKDGETTNLLVTTNIEKAKSLLIGDGWTIEVWEDDEKLGEIAYGEDEGFYNYS